MAHNSLRNYVKEHVKWFGQSAFRIATTSGGVIFIDPFRVPPSAGPADIVLVTHPHFDHFDRIAVARLRKPGTLVVVPQARASDDLEGISAKQMIRVGDIAITGVPAYNISKPFHAKSKKWVGYLVDVDGVRIYHAGDTDLIPEMREISPDIALLPVGGLFTMNYRKAAEAAALMKCGLSIPMHFGGLVLSRRAGERFAQLVGSAGCMLLPVETQSPR
jgi:L-ascorbate metabolism protein UlaG (beta-lactamase superfamily)